MIKIHEAAVETVANFIYTYSTRILIQNQLDSDVELSLNRN